MNERTRMTLAIVIAGIVLISWAPLMRGLEHLTGWDLLPKPTQLTDGSSTQPVAPTTAPTTLPSLMPVMGTTQPSVIQQTPGSVALAPLPAAVEPGKLTLATMPSTMPAPVAIGSAQPKDPTFALQIGLSPRGGGIVDVVLNDYKRAVDSEEPFIFEKPYDGTGVAALATRSVTINGQKTDLTNSVWNVEASTDRSATMSLDITDGQSPLVTIYKTFEVLPRSEGGADGPLGFDANVKYTFANRSNRPLTVSSIIAGPTFPPSEQLRGGDRQVIAGHRFPNVVQLKYDALESFSGSTLSKDYTTEEGQPLVWIGSGGNYFNTIVRPTVAAGQPSWVRKASADAVNPEVDAHLRQVAISIETTDVTLAPGTQQDLAAKVFFGPRWRSLLKNTYYAATDIGYNHTLEISGSCAFCTFQWLVDALMYLLGFFHIILRDWGLAIIALVFVVRALLHPITKRAQINMSKMQKFGPELERLKKKYANDKDALNRAMMQFYKQQGATPIMGCLPMLLQMPIWIALYSGLSTTFELRLQPFLYGLTWIQDLAKPDHLIAFETPVHLLFFTLDGLNIIPFLMAGAFWMQAYLQPKPVAMSPEQEQQQKMMQWMTLLFPVFLYSSPSGLNIYILTSTVFGIIENKIIRKHIKEQEAREAAGPVIVDADIIDADQTPRSKSTSTTAVAKPGGIFGWFQNLQERAEQLKQDAERKAQQQQRKKK